MKGTCTCNEYAHEHEHDYEHVHVHEYGYEYGYVNEYGYGYVNEYVTLATHSREHRDDSREQHLCRLVVGLRDEARDVTHVEQAPHSIAEPRALT